MFKKFWPIVIGCVLRTEGSSLIRNYADQLISLELLNFYLILAMIIGRLAYFVIQRNDTTSVFFICLMVMQEVYFRMLGVLPHFIFGKLEFRILTLNLCSGFVSELSP